MTERFEKAISLAMKAFREENGDLEEGDSFAAVFDDGVVIVNLFDGEIKIDIHAGEPYKINYRLELIEEAE